MTFSLDDYHRWSGYLRMGSSTGQLLGPAAGTLFSSVSLDTVLLAAGGVLILGGVIAACLLQGMITSRRAPDRLTRARRQTKLPSWKK
jgi:hypothetical protein